MYGLKSSLSIRAVVEAVFAFSVYASVLGFIVAGVLAMCMPGIDVV